MTKFLLETKYKENGTVMQSTRADLRSPWWTNDGVEETYGVFPARLRAISPAPTVCMAILSYLKSEDAHNATFLSTFF